MAVKRFRSVYVEKLQEPPVMSTTIYVLTQIMKNSIYVLIQNMTNITTFI